MTNESPDRLQGEPRTESDREQRVDIQRELQTDKEPRKSGGVTTWDWWAGVLPAMAVAPLMIGQALTLAESPSTSLAPIVWITLGGVIAWRGKGSVSLNPWRISTAVVVLVLAAILYGSAVFYWSFSLAHWAAAIFLIAWGLGRFDQTGWSQVLAWGCVLALTNPLPQFDDELNRVLNETAAHFASMALDVYRVPHLAEEGAILLKDGQFAAISATSPRLGLVAVLWFAALWCCLKSRSFLHSLLNLCAVPLWILLVRYVAVLVIAYGVQQHQQNWSLGPFHVAISVGAFMSCVALVLCFDRFLSAMLAPIPVTDLTTMPIFAAANELISWPSAQATPVLDLDAQEIAPSQQLSEDLESNTQGLDWSSHRVLSSTMLSASGAIAILLVISLAVIARSGLRVTPGKDPTLKLANFEKLFSMNPLPKEIGRFQLVDTTFGPEASSLGDQAEEQSSDASGNWIATWTYQWSELLVTIRLTAERGGWQAPFDSRASRTTRTLQEVEEPSNENSKWGLFRFRQMSPYGGMVYVYQCGMNDDLTPSIFTQYDEVHRSSLWSRLRGNVAEDLASLHYEMTLHCDAGAPLTNSEQTELFAFFDRIRNAIRENLQPGKLAESVNDSVNADGEMAK